MATGAVGKKIDDYARQMTKQLKAEEAQTGRKMTKYDVAMQMLSSGKLSQAEFTSWMNTTEGFDAKTLSEQTKQALMRGSVFGMPGYSGGDESYLDSLVSFSNKTPIQQQNIIHSPRQSKLSATVAERKRQAAQMQETIKQNNQKKAVLNPEKALQEQKFLNYLNSLPEVSQSYTDLMNDIKFQELDKKGQVELLLKTTGQKFYEAKEKGDKAAMKQYLIEGFGLAFAHMDNASGITDLKEGFKKYSGLNALVEAVDKFVDNGDDANLTTGEKAWNMVKGAGDAVDSFVGTQGIAFIGALAAASEAAASAGIGKLFSVIVQGYFGIEGGTMVLGGTKDAMDATTEQEARTAGQEIGTGAIMLGGAVKSVTSGVKGGVKNAKGNSAEPKPTAETPEPATKTMKPNEQAKPVSTEPAKPTLRADDMELFEKLAEENPEVFGVKPKPAPAETAKPNAALLNDIKNAAQNSKYDASVVTSMMEKYPDVIQKLAQVKGPDGQKLFSAQDISDILFNCKSTIENNPERLFAVLSNPKEIADIAGWKSHGAGLWRAVGDPLDSTVEANPEVFGVKPKPAPAETAKPNAALLNDIKKAAQNSEYDASVVTSMMEKHPDVVQKLAQVKGPDGQKLFSAQDISDILFNCKSTIENNPERLFAVLSNPKEIADIAGWKSHGAGLWRAVGDPLSSTIEANPEAFRVKPKPAAKTAEAKIRAEYRELFDKLIEYKDEHGTPILSSEEIAELVKNCQHGFITDGKPIPNYQAKIEAVLSNPEEVAALEGWKSKPAGVWRAIQDPLDSTVEANPEVFGVKPKPAPAGTAKPNAALLNDIKNAAQNSKYDASVVTSMMEKYPDVIQKLAQVKGPDGQKLFSAQDISDILFNCKSTIENTPERLFAVLSNPKEIADIAGWKSHGAGLWRAVGDPLSSTIEANPEVFGAKPKPAP